MTVQQRRGLHWVDQTSPGSYTVQQQYVPNVVALQVPQTTYVPQVVTQKVPIQVTRYVDEVEVRKVPVQVCRTQQEVQVRKIPYTVQRPVSEEKSRTRFRSRRAAGSVRRWSARSR